MQCFNDTMIAFIIEMYVALIFEQFWVRIIELAKIMNHCYHDSQTICNEFLLTVLAVKCMILLFILHLLPAITCTIFPSTTVATTGWTGCNWQKLLIWWWERKHQHHNPQCGFKCSYLSTSFSFPVNYKPHKCWNRFCCLRHWITLPNHKCNRANSGDKCIHYNSCG